MNSVGRPLFQIASPAACVASALLCGALSAPGAAAAAAGGGTAGKGPQKGKMPGGKPGNIPGATGEKTGKHVKGCRRVFTGVSFTTCVEVEITWRRLTDWRTERSDEVEPRIYRCMSVEAQSATT